MADQPDPLIPPAIVGEPRAAARLGLDLFWAYAASGAKVLSWVVVTGLVFRRLGAFDLGVLALARATIGLLNYTGVGLAPALVHYMAKALAAPPRAVPVVAPHAPGAVLSYETPAEVTPRFPTHTAYSNGLQLALVATTLGFIALFIYSSYFDEIHHIKAIGAHRGRIAAMALFLGAGVLLRLLSDVPGAVLQTTGWLWVDYAIVALGEATWVGLLWFAANNPTNRFELDQVGTTYAFSGTIVLGLRWLFAGRRQRLLLIDSRLVNRREAGALLAFGGTVLLAQLADFLYAPTALILIHHLLGPRQAAYYTPAVQIDAGLLLGVGGLAAVLLPRAAEAHARGDARAIRQFYLRGTAACLLLLAVAAALIWALAPILLRWWLGADLPPTRAVLPLVLASTVIGGTAGIGRSVLLGMGKVNAYTASALVAGVLNVVLGYIFVKFGGMGLKGIALATLCVVLARCAIWMPWYVLRVTAPATTAPSRS